MSLANLYVAICPFPNILIRHASCNSNDLFQQVFVGDVVNQGHFSCDDTVFYQDSLPG